MRCTSSKFLTEVLTRASILLYARVALVSGFSVNVAKMVMSGKTDPFECLLETLNTERYAPVEKALKGYVAITR